MKTCSKCKEVKSKSKFSKNSSSKDKLSCQCKSCDSLFKLNNKEKIKKQRLEYLSLNKDKTNEAQRKYRENNRESVSAKSRDYLKNKITEEQKEKIKDIQKKYKENNKESIKIQRSNYNKQNQLKRRLIQSKRRALMLSSGKTLSKGLIEKLFELQKGNCICCDMPLIDGYHIDHIMPLSLGGKHIDENIQLLRIACNISKSNKHPEIWKRERKNNGY